MATTTFETKFLGNIFWVSPRPALMIYELEQLTIIYDVENV